MDPQQLGTSALHKLDDTNFTVSQHEQDIRGRKLLDREGEELGKVDALFIDDQEKKVRFLRVACGGFLGLGKTKFLIPVDAVRRIDDEVVHVDQTRRHVAGAPSYDPEIVERPDHYQSLYGYYGYQPYWTSGYVYPPIAWPRAPRGPFV